MHPLQLLLGALLFAIVLEEFVGFIIGLWPVAEVEGGSE